MKITRFITVFLFSAQITGLGQIGPLLADSAWPEAYSRRIYQLGITLSEFKNMKYPDAKQSSGAYPVCSNDPGIKSNYRMYKTVVRGVWAQAGVIKCNYYQNDKFLGPSTTGLMLDDIFSITEFYFLPKSAGGAPVLFLIITKGPSERFLSIVSLYKKAIGKPSIVQNKYVQNRIGANFSKKIIIYKNKVSTIQLSQYGDTLHIFEIKHLLDPVMKRLLKVIDKIEKERSKKL